MPATQPDWPVETGTADGGSIQKLKERLTADGGSIEDLEERLARQESALAQIVTERRAQANRINILVFSGTFDKLFAAFMIATGAASMAMEVTMFFAFWGTVGVRQKRMFGGKGALERAFTAMLPASPGGTNPSRFSFGGLGRIFFRHLIRKHQMQQLEELVSLARELNVRMMCCNTSMELLGLSAAELFPEVGSGGVAAYLETACQSGVTLFI